MNTLVLADVLEKEAKLSIILMLICIIGLLVTCIIPEFFKMFELNVHCNNIARTSNLFLNSFNLSDLQFNGFFTRIGHYIGHGLCYEASAVEMMAWKGEKNSVMVYGMAYSDTVGEYVNHCWVEVKQYGLWWVIDSAWEYPVHPVLKSEYARKYKVKDMHYLSYDEFWSCKAINDIYECMKKAEESYVFGLLATFRCNEDNEVYILILDYDPNKINNRGIYLMYLSYDKPISQRIFRQFAMNPKVETPKRKNYRRAITMKKTLIKSHEEAKNFCSKTGKKCIVEITGLNTFEIRAE